MASSCNKWLAVFGVFLFAACGGDDDAKPLGEVDASTGGSTSQRCVDEDGDGYGEGRCRYGKDCDDEDPDVGDECFRCPICDDCLEEGRTDCEGCTGCPCEEGTAAVTCRLPESVLNSEGVECNEGVMKCRDSKWTECQTSDTWLGT
jgi:hypothetical protein